MRIIFGTDANGAQQAAMIRAEGEKLGTCIDVSEYNAAHHDYIRVSAAVCSRVRKARAVGVLLCGTGAGTAICANKHKGIYAVTCFDPEQARNARRINNANVVCIAATTDIETNLAILRAFITTRYHNRKPHRIRAVKALERKLCK